MATRKPNRPARRPGRSASRTTGARARTRGKRPADRTGKGPQALRIRAFEPTFTVDDVERSERFYTEVVGFVVDQRWTEDGRLLGVLLKAGGNRLGLSQDDWAKGRDRKKGVGFSLWCQTDQDIDALAARIKGAGGRLASEPKDEAGLGRNLALDDPDGFRLRIYRRQ
jgi:catechol 2,3-dioxygenase-like lactoylglutathione lyase family enzyme